MLKVADKKDLLIKVFSYLLIIAAAFISTIVYFNDGIASGDDITFHLSMTNDVLYGLKNGYWTMSTNHIFMGGYAINNFGFYGPLTHYSAGIFTFLLEWAGATPIIGLKAVVVLSALMGGIYSYLFALKVSNKNRIVSLLCAIMFIFLPYRIFCALCRCAFAESVAICFIPLVFYGCYSIVHDSKYSVHPYIALCLGGIGIVLSHAFTGLVTAVFAALYLIFNIKNLIKKREGFSIWPSFIASAVVCFMGLFFYVGNAMYYKSTGLYNLCDPERMWTTYQHVADSTQNSNSFSGFLNFFIFSNWQGQPYWNNETVTSIAISILVYFGSMVICLVADILCRLLPKNKYYRYFVDAAVTVILPIVTFTRQEVWISIILSFILFLFISLVLDGIKKNIKKDDKKLWLNPDFYFAVFALIICLLFIYIPGMWKIVPSVMYQAQFAWRLWGIATFFMVMLAAILLSKIKGIKPILIAGSIVISSLCALSMGPIEKRVAFEANQSSIIINGGEDFAKSIKYSGAQNEMVPQVFNDMNYVSEYENSLFKQIQRNVLYQINFTYDIDSYIQPVFLEGTGSIKIIEYNTPENMFDFNVTSETALVQFPQFYYAGYRAVIDGTENAPIKNVDGLLSITLPKGVHQLKLRFVQSEFVQIGMPLFYAGISILIVGGAFGVYYRKKIIPNKIKEK